MASSNELLGEIAEDLRRVVDGMAKEQRVQADAAASPGVLSLIDDLRLVTVKMALVLERLIDVTNLNTIEDRLDRWPHPSLISLPDTEKVH